MIAKLIPTRIHGVLDYLTGLALIAIPLLFNWPQPEAAIFMVLGAGALVYSLITRYELGVFKLLPMPAHLVLDLLSGLFLVAAPFLGLAREDLQGWFWAFGAFEIAAALLTSTRPHFAADDINTGYASSDRTDAGYTSTSMTGHNTTIGEGDRDTRFGATNTTYTGSSRTASAEQQTLPDDAGWTTANRSAAMGTMGETAATREDAQRADYNRDTANR
jgi:hypothetical protein